MTHLFTLIAQIFLKWPITFQYQGPQLHLPVLHSLSLGLANLMLGVTL